jgi:hypothetical protein
MKPLVPNGTACLKFLKRREKREEKKGEEWETGFRWPGFKALTEALKSEL